MTRTILTNHQLIELDTEKDLERLAGGWSGNDSRLRNIQTLLEAVLQELVEKER